MKKSNPEAFFNRFKAFIHYFWTGIWRDSRNTTGVRILKTLNLSIRSFLDTDLQSKSMALTYSTVLALVPALALILAICRGFGLQDLLLQALPQYFPAQAKSINTAMDFVDHYLKEASGGIFVGIGLVVLLYTLISLLSYIEDAFNNIWGIKQSRSLYQKITDYIAICLIVPILLICSSGISIFVSTTLADRLSIPFLTPFVNISMELMPVILAWLAFTFSYFLIPNTKVQFKYAVISGALCAIAFQILQLLFVNGQIYVSKYNAIYGSFSFLPLLLIWLQFSWLILLFGCVLTYSLQNVFAFNYLGDINNISSHYLNKLIVVIAAIIYKRFADEKTPYTRSALARTYNIPVRIVTRVCDKLLNAKLIYNIALKDDIGLTPATDPDDMSIGRLLDRLSNCGDSDFIPGFDIAFQTISSDLDNWTDKAFDDMNNIRLIDLPLPSPSQMHEILKF